MLGKLKERLFPCEKLVKRLMDSHADSIRMNNEAHERLQKVCRTKEDCEPKEEKTKSERLQDAFLKVPAIGGLQ